MIVLPVVGKYHQLFLFLFLESVIKGISHNLNINSYQSPLWIYISITMFYCIFC